jgi:uncharacterized protein YeaO (DUF488 family)
VAPRGLESEAPCRGVAEGGRTQHGAAKWFSHDPDKWGEFRRRYFRELNSRPEAWQPIVSAARRGTVTLVYSSHDTQHNNAIALHEYLRRKARRLAKSRRAGAPGRARRSVR